VQLATHCCNGIENEDKAQPNMQSTGSTMDHSNPKRRHRIAMVCDFFYPNLGGVENHIYSLSQKLIESGHKVIIITHQYSGNKRQGVRYLPGPLKVYYCPIVPMGSSANVAVPTFTATLPLLRYILLREQIDIVHAHQATSTMGNESIVYASMMGIATIYTDHSLFGFSDIASVILNRVLQTTLCTIDAAICVSHTCRDNFILRTKLTKQQSKINDNLKRDDVLLPKIHVIPNAVSPSQFLPPSLLEIGQQSAPGEDVNDR
jgi:phosphatidylinositol N-acetylglucosaminyltransferase subunit A